LKVSTLFLDIKGGFNTVNNPTLGRNLREGSVSPYLVWWVASFRGERIYTPVFQGTPGTPAPVNIGASQGSPFSLLFFLIYVAPLHFRILRGLMLSDVDNFALTVASRSYCGNIRRLQELFKAIKAKAVYLGISFSIAKTGLIHWRTPSQRHSQWCLSSIQPDRELFHPRASLRWLGYWCTPTLSTAAHLSRYLALAQRAFALIRHLSLHGAGLAPYLCHRLATSLVTPIVLYRADLFSANAGSLSRLNTFWHKVQRWATNGVSSTPIGILAIESCLPHIPLLVSQQQRLAALRTVRSTPGINPATARLHPSFPSLASSRPPDASRGLRNGISSVYLPQNWETPCLSPPLTTHLPVYTVAHRTIPFTRCLSHMGMINEHQGPELWALLPPSSLMTGTYSALKKRVRLVLIGDWNRLFSLPAYYHQLPALHTRPFMGLHKLTAGHIHKMRAGKSYLAAHPSWRAPEADTSCPCGSLEPERFEYTILACPCRQDARARLLHGITSVGQEAPLWSSLPLLKELATQISATSTGFPPTMLPPTTPPSAPPFPLSPRILPCPVFRVFSLAEV